MSRRRARLDEAPRSNARGARTSSWLAGLASTGLVACGDSPAEPEPNPADLLPPTVTVTLPARGAMLVVTGSPGPHNVANPEYADELAAFDTRRALVIALSFVPPAIVGYGLEREIEAHRAREVALAHQPRVERPVAGRDHRRRRDLATFVGTGGREVRAPTVRDSLFEGVAQDDRLGTRLRRERHHDRAAVRPLRVRGDGPGSGRRDRGGAGALLRAVCGAL